MNPILNRNNYVKQSNQAHPDLSQLSDSELLQTAKKFSKNGDIPSMLHYLTFLANRENSPGQVTFKEKANACYMLACFYEEGTLVTGNEDLSDRYLKQASDLSHLAATNKLRDIYLQFLHLTGGEEYRELEKQYFFKAIDLENSHWHF